MAFHCSLTLARVCCRVCLTEFFAQIVTKADLETASKGLDNANKRPTKEQLKFVETNKDRVGMPRMKQTLDNGFDALSADEYIAVRPKPALEELKERWGYSNECLAETM